ncbi:hypothetical protein [Planctomicrobium sp. SH664]|uniref:hypothetical protein n=1 Tax=Planctomicrobium sp. SH664 TaxID=3448125 RepID=UPI003F5CA585
MATLTPYKGLDVVEGATGAGGIALTDNFKELADRAPYQSGSNPTTGSDSSQGFAVNDQWLNTSTGVTWVCTNASVGAAVWKSFYSRSSTSLNLIPAESSEEVTVAGKLTVTGTGDSSIAGNVGIGTTSPGNKLHVSSSTGSADAARFVSTNSNMSVYIESYPTGQAVAGLVLRNASTGDADRTMFLRTLSTHGAANRLLVLHYVSSTPGARVE